MNESQSTSVWLVQLFLRDHLYSGSMTFEDASDAVDSANDALQRGVVDQAVIAHRDEASVARRFTAPQDAAERHEAVSWLQAELSRLRTTAASARVASRE